MSGYRVKAAVIYAGREYPAGSQFPLEAVTVGGELRLVDHARLIKDGLLCPLDDACEQCDCDRKDKAKAKSKPKVVEPPKEPAKKRGA